MEQSLIFGDVISSDYGIYISGEGVFNAPRRDAEMISIPGRNGTYLLDHNRFDNIVVAYPAHCVADNMDEFRSKLRDYRNALSAKRGYQRLSDTINGDEYRMASFIDGFDSEPIGFSLASTFELKFNCKPQRFLKIGEIETPVSSGGIITNPTLFESHPLLLVDGYGEFDINGEKISIQQGAVMGETILDETDTSTTFVSSSTKSFRMTRKVNNLDVALNGDEITLGVTLFSFTLENGQYSDFYVNSATSQDDGKATVGVYFIQSLRFPVQISVTVDKLTFTKGTASSLNYRPTFGYNWITNDEGGASGTDDWNIAVNINYDGDSTFLVSLGISPQRTPALTVNNVNNWEIKGYESKVNSTKSALGQLYIDLDIGECYRIENGQIISINTATILPADLPTLKPGDNVITYDNTFTSFKVTPRYWRV